MAVTKKQFDIEALPGERWFPLETSFEEDMKEYWGDWGVCSEVDTLKDAAPGRKSTILTGRQPALSVRSTRNASVRSTMRLHRYTAITASAYTMWKSNAQTNQTPSSCATCAS